MIKHVIYKHLWRSGGPGWFHTVGNIFLLVSKVIFWTRTYNTFKLFVISTSTFGRIWDFLIHLKSYINLFSRTREIANTSSSLIVAVTEGRCIWSKSSFAYRLTIKITARAKNCHASHILLNYNKQNRFFFFLIYIILITED